MTVFSYRWSLSGKWKFLSRGQWPFPKGKGSLDFSEKVPKRFLEKLYSPSAYMTGAQSPGHTPAAVRRRYFLGCRAAGSVQGSACAAWGVEVGRLQQTSATSPSASAPLCQAHPSHGGAGGEGGVEGHGLF